MWTADILCHTLICLSVSLNTSPTSSSFYYRVLLSVGAGKIAQLGTQQTGASSPCFCCPLRNRSTSLGPFWGLSICVASINQTRDLPTWQSGVMLQQQPSSVRCYYAPICVGAYNLHVLDCQTNIKYSFFLNLIRGLSFDENCWTASAVSQDGTWLLIWSWCLKV